MQKKYFVLGMIAVLVLLCTGCNIGKNSGKDTDFNTGNYVIAIEDHYEPFAFEGEDQTLTGLDVELLDAIFENQGVDYSIESLDLKEAARQLEEGMCQGIMAALPITKDRKKIYDFSEAYFENYVGMAVMQNSGMKNYKALKEKKAGAVMQSLGSSFLDSIAEKYNIKVIYYENYENLFEGLNTGECQAVFGDYPILSYYIKQGANARMVENVKEKEEQFAFATAKGKNAELIQIFNEGLKKIKEDGTYDKIIEKYTKTDNEKTDFAPVGSTSDENAVTEASTQNGEETKTEAQASTQEKNTTTETSTETKNATTQASTEAQNATKEETKTESSSESSSSTEKKEDTKTTQHGTNEVPIG